VSLGRAISRPRGGRGPAAARDSRVVVVGDSDFVANYSGNVPGNAEMFLSMVRWLAQDTVVPIPPRLPQERLLTLDGTQLRLLRWFALLLLPGIALAAGAYVGRGVR
jgi:ABC-type uncharacterized transport system involved in gliding motility auxiliary subunit